MVSMGDAGVHSVHEWQEAADSEAVDLATAQPLPSWLAWCFVVVCAALLPSTEATSCCPPTRYAAGGLAAWPGQPCPS